MSLIDKKFIPLRVNLRKHGPAITEDVFYRHHPITDTRKKEICVFCKSTAPITKEHVLPKWVFERDINSSFISGVNRQTQTYNKAVIPTCSVCNNSLLAPIEKEIIAAVQRLAEGEIHDTDDLSNIIRWLELLDYKGQVYDLRRKYIKHGNSAYDMHWGIFTVAMMRHFFDMDPFKAYDFLRSTQRRITVKAKYNRLNSLAVLKTAFPHFNFFVQPNEYIFISIPIHQIAFFYFFRKQYANPVAAAEDALILMERVFKS